MPSNRCYCHGWNDTAGTPKTTGCTRQPPPPTWNYRISPEGMIILFEHEVITFVPWGFLSSPQWGRIARAATASRM